MQHSCLTGSDSQWKRMTMQNELKPNRSGNYHHNGNPKHGLYRDNEELVDLERIKEGADNG